MGNVEAQPARPYGKTERPVLTLNQFRSGDPGAIKASTDYLARLARRMGANGSEKDVVQEAFLRSISPLKNKNEGDFGINGDITPYLITAVRGVIVDGFRQAAKSVKTADVSIEEAWGVSDPTVNVEAQVVHKLEALETISHLKSEISSEFMDVLWLFYFEELSYKDISVRLNIPPGTVMSRLNRARMHARKVFGNVA